MSVPETWDDIDENERAALLELARARANGSVTRRDALIGGGAILAGGAIGGGASQAVGTAAADASTSDGDGDVGTPSNPIDVFADGVDATSVNAEKTVIGRGKAISGGGDLADAVSTAIQNNYSRIVVEETADGSAWTWGSDLTINPLDHDGIEIDISDGARIEYGGTGWPLTVDTGGPSEANAYPTNPFTIRGGRWYATGDAAGWLKVKDLTHARIEPRYIEFENSTDDAVGISLENHERFCEDNYVTGKINANIGVDFVPVEDTGGTNGTGSFADSHFEQVHISSNNIGMRFRGEVFHSLFETVVIFPGDATGLRMDARSMGATLFTGCKLESQPEYTNDVAFDLGPDYLADGNTRRPTWIGGEPVNFTTKVSPGNGFDTVHRYAASGGYHTFRDAGISILWGDGSEERTVRKMMNADATDQFREKLTTSGSLNLFLDNAGAKWQTWNSEDGERAGINVGKLESSTGDMELSANDLNTVGASHGEMYRHDGSASISADGGTTSAEGYYVWSGNDGEWKQLAAI